MIDRRTAARNAWLVQYAMDMSADQSLGQLTPLPDPRLSPNWNLVGYLQARDTLFKLGPFSFGQEVCYGFVAVHTLDPTEYVAVIRGTNGFREWLEDADFLPVSHPVAGTVEAGFWGIHTSMKLQTLDGNRSAAAPAIAKLLPPDAIVTVIGHSLGAPLATYLSMDLAALIGDRVKACLFASPKPGSDAFCLAYAAAVKEYALYNRDRDIVPQVPHGPDYATLPGQVLITSGTSQAKIQEYLSCYHHVLCYAAEICYDYTDWQHAGSKDISLLGCILGPLQAP